MPLFQSESKCEIILMKMTLICMKMDYSFPHERFRTYTRFEREAQENSEMAYSLIRIATNEIAAFCIDNRLRQMAFFRVRQSGQGRWQGPTFG